MASLITLSYRPAGKDLRRDKRLRQPTFEVELYGQTWRSSNWSMGGLFLADYQGPLRRDDIVEGTLIGHTRDGEERHPFRAEVIRDASEKPGLALAFEPGDSGPAAFLEHCLLRVIRSHG
jgi:hypothetical protein